MPIKGSKWVSLLLRGVFNAAFAVQHEGCVRDSATTAVDTESVLSSLAAEITAKDSSNGAGSVSLSAFTTDTDVLVTRVRRRISVWIEFDSSCAS